MLSKAFKENDYTRWRGATKVITINIHKTETAEEARLIAYKLANSNLIKTAMFGADPN